MNIQGKKNCFEVHVVPIGTQYGMKVVILCRLFLCVLHDAAFFFKDSKPITRKDVISPDNRTQYCTFTAEMCIRVYTCGGHLNQRSGWDVGLSMPHGWVIFLSGVWFLFKTDQTLTCDLDLWPWPPFVKVINLLLMWKKVQIWPCLHLLCQSFHPVERKFDLWPWPIFGSFKVNTLVTEICLHFQCHPFHSVERKFDLWPWPIFGSFKENTLVTVYPKYLRMWYSSDRL